MAGNGKPAPTLVNGQAAGQAGHEGGDNKDQFWCNLKSFVVRNLSLLPQFLYAVISPILDFLELSGWLVVVFVFFLLGIVWDQLKVIGADRLLDSFTEKYTHGESMVQWNDTKLLDKPAEEFQQLKEALTSADFNSSVAKSLLLLSTLVYENDPIIDQKAGNWGFNHKELPGIRTRVQVFHDDKSKIIVIAFRGTNPINLSEWLLDINFIKKNGIPDILGQIHQGFAERLFDPPSKEKKNLHTHIIERIEEITRKDSKDTEKKKKEGKHKWKVWITGHSLGGALATLFYSRLAQDHRVLPVESRLVGAYTFGCPRTGDYDYVTITQTLLDRNYSEKPNIWRVVNALDGVARVPFGVECLVDPKRLSLVRGLWDYVHLGTQIQLHYNSPLETIDPNQSPIGLYLRLGWDYIWAWGNFRRFFQSLVKGNLPKAFSWLVPVGLMDHTPALYYENLGRF